MWAPPIQSLEWALQKQAAGEDAAFSITGAGAASVLERRIRSSESAVHRRRQVRVDACWFTGAGTHFPTAGTGVHVLDPWRGRCIGSGRCR